MLLLDYEFPPEAPLRRQLGIVYSQWLKPCGVAMQTAVDCVLLLYFARTTGKTGLHHRIQRLHISVIEALRTGIQAPDAAHNDSILGAIDVLAIAAQFRELAPTKYSWVTHADALERVFEARGPLGLSSSVFARNVLFNFVFIMLVRAIDTRKPLFLGKPDWQMAMQPHCDSIMSPVALIAARIPTILAQVDYLLQQPKSRSESFVTLLVSEITGVKAKLKNWLDTWYPASSSLRPVVFRIATLEERFPQFLQRFHHLPCLFPFASPHTFDIALDAMHYGWYWICLLETQQAALTLATFVSTNPNSRFLATRSESPDQLLEECNKVAEALCRTIPYLLYAEQLPYAQTAICTVVTYAEKWYERTKQRVKAGWCQSIRSDLENQDLNNPLEGDLSCVKRVFVGSPMFIHGSTQQQTCPAH